jgi:hypothetical protein
MLRPNVLAASVALRLEKICRIDRTGDRWMKVGDFTPAAAKPKKKKTKKAAKSAYTYREPDRW